MTSIIRLWNKKLLKTALSQIEQFCILYEIPIFYSVKKLVLIFANNFKPEVFVMKLNNLVSRCSIQLSSFWDKALKTKDLIIVFNKINICLTN